MKIRIISSVVGLSILVFAISLSRESLAAIVFILSLAGIWEFNNAMAKTGLKPVKPVGYIMSLGLLYIGFKNSFHVSHILEAIAFEPPDVKHLYTLMLFIVFIFLFIMYVLPVFMYGKYSLADISVTLYGIFYVVFFFAFIILTRGLEHGLYFVWFIFLGAWATDTFALLGGRYFGKRKLAPGLSPNKTVEGAVGGLLGAVLITVTYGLLFKPVSLEMAKFHFPLMGIISGIISQAGDLVASSTKRFTKIKDFGKIIPGHGGILDRFDSILFLAPAIYFYLIFFVI